MNQPSDGAEETPIQRGPDPEEEYLALISLDSNDLDRLGVDSEAESITYTVTEDGIIIE